MKKLFVLIFCASLMLNACDRIPEIEHWEITFKSGRKSEVLGAELVGSWYYIAPMDHSDPYYVAVDSVKSLKPVFVEKSN